MTSITIALSDDLMSKLKNIADFHQINPEDLVRATVEDLINSQSSEFNVAIDQVLTKNRELYTRLAK